MSCFPLNSVTEALGVTHVDYLSLDVEGPELEILATVDWTRLRVDVITVEYRVRLRPPRSGAAPGGSSRPGGWVITVEYRVMVGKRLGIDGPATRKKLGDLRRFFSNTGVTRRGFIHVRSVR